VILGTTGVDSRLTAVRKLDGAGEARARTRAEDAGAGGDATEALAGLRVGDERRFILSVVLRARIGMSTCSRCWHCTTSFSKVSWSGNV
jgi:hypothetical protein